MNLYGRMKWLGKLRAHLLLPLYESAYHIINTNNEKNYLAVHQQPAGTISGHIQTQMAAKHIVGQIRPARVTGELHVKR